jgi:hypothetical protein
VPTYRLTAAATAAYDAAMLRKAFSLALERNLLPRGPKFLPLIVSNNAPAGFFEHTSSRCCVGNCRITLCRSRASPYFTGWRRGEQLAHLGSGGFRRRRDPARRGDHQEHPGPKESGTGSDNHRNRDIPKMLDILTQLRLQCKAFRQHVRKGSDNLVQVYDFRRTFATWMESAGIARARCRAYMGHTHQDMTDLCEAVEVSQYLEEDGTRFLDWLEHEKSHVADSLQTQRNERERTFRWQK